MGTGIEDAFGFGSTQSFIWPMGANFFRTGNLDFFGGGGLLGGVERSASIRVIPGEDVGGKIVGIGD